MIFRSIQRLILFLFLIWNFKSYSQNSKLIVLPQIKLPKDTLVRSKLLKSINQFLNDKNGDLKFSSVIDSNHYKRYADFFDIFKNAENSKRYNDINFFKCYLKNVVLQPDKSYHIDLSYSGITKENEVVNRLNVSLLAKETNQNFLFYCLFERNTQYWKTTKIGKINFYYKSNFNKTVAIDFNNYNTVIANKLNLQPIQFDFFNCKDIQEVYKLFGIDYDITRNGEVRSGLFDIKNKLFVAGTNSDQYKHDLTHAYFSLKFADSLRNWTAEEGYNIYTTDYWGETTEQIFKYLKEYVKQNPKASLYDAFQINIDLKDPIPIKYPISALLVRKVEREFGILKVLELVSSGENDDQYFTILNKLIGLTKENFDEIVKNELQK